MSEYGHYSRPKVKISLTNKDLPDLPVKKTKTEATITTLKIMPWIRENLDTCAFEIKATYKKSMPVSVVKDHQLKALLAVRAGTFVHKLSDAGHVRLPFDGIVLKKMPAYVIAAFCGDSERVALVIPVENWHGCMSDSPFAVYRIPLGRGKKEEL